MQIANVVLKGVRGACACLRSQKKKRQCSTVWCAVSLESNNKLCSSISSLRYEMPVKKTPRKPDVFSVLHQVLKSLWIQMKPYFICNSKCCIWHKRFCIFNKVNGLWFIACCCFRIRVYCLTLKRGDAVAKWKCFCSTCCSGTLLTCERWCKKVFCVFQIHTRDIIA